MSENYLMELSLVLVWNFPKIKGISSKSFSEYLRKCLRRNLLLIEFNPLLPKLMLLLNKSKQKIHHKWSHLVALWAILWEHGLNKLHKWLKKENNHKFKLNLKSVISLELKSCMIPLIILKKLSWESTKCAIVKNIKYFKWIIVLLRNKLKMLSLRFRSSKQFANYNWPWNKMKVNTTSLTQSMKLRDLHLDASLEVISSCQKDFNTFS